MGVVAGLFDDPAGRHDQLIELAQATLEPCQARVEALEVVGGLAPAAGHYAAPRHAGRVQTAEAFCVALVTREID